MKLRTNDCDDFRKMIYKYWLANKYCDIILIGADGKNRIPAHRVVLDASSQYFVEQIANAATNAMDEIVVAAIDGGTLERLVGACYSGTLEVNENSVSSLYMGAIHLRLNSILAVIDSYIVAQLSKTNCLHFYHLAETFSRSVLLKATEDYISAHFIQIADQPSFLELDAKKFKGLFCLKDLHVPSAENLFRDVLKWIQHDPDGHRDNVLSELLPHLRLSAMSPNFLLFHVKPHCKTIATYDIIFEALKTQFESTEPVPTIDIERLPVPIKDVIETLPVTIKDVIEPLPVTAKDVKVERKQLIVVVSSCSGNPEILEYSFVQQKWNNLATLPNKVNSFSVTHSTALKSLCFVGGFLNESIVRDVLLWNVYTHKFTTLIGMLDRRYDGGITSINDGSDENGDIIVAGRCEFVKHLSTVERWSRKSGKWYSLESTTESRYGARLVTVGNLIYCLGGENATENVKLVECYNLMDKHWSIVAPMNHGRYACGTWIDGKKLYVIGGGSDVIECYDPEANLWTDVCFAKGSACIKTSVRHNNRLFAFGYDTVLISDGDWRIWEKSDTIEPIDDYFYGGFSIPLEDFR